MCICLKMKILWFLLITQFDKTEVQEFTYIEIYSLSQFQISKLPKLKNIRTQKLSDPKKLGFTVSSIPDQILYGIYVCQLFDRQFWPGCKHILIDQQSNCRISKTTTCHLSSNNVSYLSFISKVLVQTSISLSF